MSDEDPTSDAATIDSLEELDDGETYHYVHAERGDDTRTFRVDRRHADADDFADYGVPQHRERVIILGERIIILGERIDVMAMPDEGNPQLHIGATPGQVGHPESFRDRHYLTEPDQATLGAFADDPETLDELVEQVIQEGIETC